MLWRVLGPPAALVLLLGACATEDTTPPPGPTGEELTPTPDAEVVEFREGTASLVFSGSLEGEVELSLGGEVDSQLDLVEWDLDLGYAGDPSLDPEVPPASELIVQGPVTLGAAPTGRALAISIVFGAGDERFAAEDEEATCITDFQALDEAGVAADLECVGLQDEAGGLFDVRGSFTAAP